MTMALSQPLPPGDPQGKLLYFVILYWLPFSFIAIGGGSYISVKKKIIVAMTIMSILCSIIVDLQLQRRERLVKKKVVKKVVQQIKKSSPNKMAQARESRPLVPDGEVIERTVEVVSPRSNGRLYVKNTKLKASAPGDRAVTRDNRLSSTGDKTVLVQKSSSSGHQRATAADGWRISSREEKHVRKVSSSDRQFSSSEQKTTSPARKTSVPDRKISLPDKRPTSPVHKISARHM